MIIGIDFYFDQLCSILLVNIEIYLLIKYFSKRCHLNHWKTVTLIYLVIIHDSTYPTNLFDTSSNSSVIDNFTNFL